MVSIELTTQIEMHPYVFHAPNMQRLLELQHRHNIIVQSYGPLSSLVRFQGGPVDAVVEGIAKDRSATTSQVLLAWAARYTGGVVVT